MSSPLQHWRNASGTQSRPHIEDIMQRRSLLLSGGLLLIGATARPTQLFAEAKRRVRIGLITDLHYADKPPAGTRHYRETLTKLGAAGGQFAQDKVDLIVELGDLIDAADTVAVEQSYLACIQKACATLPGDKHYVLGNHCVDMLTKDEFLAGVGQKKAYYSFDAGGFHFVILDACFTSEGKPYGRKNSKWDDANIPDEELKWLADDLKATELKTIVFAHQRLDVQNSYGIKNAADIRKTLESSGKVLAVFHGHSHKNDLTEINGIPYCTLVAMVEGSGAEHNGYSTLDVFEGGDLKLTGFREQKSYTW
jgi:alkaline phosphatase